MMTAFDLAGLKIHQSFSRILQKSRYIAALPQREWRIQRTDSRQREKALSRLPRRLHYAENVVRF